MIQKLPSRLLSMFGCAAPRALVSRPPLAASSNRCSRSESSILKRAVQAKSNSKTITLLNRSDSFKRLLVGTPAFLAVRARSNNSPFRSSTKRLQAFYACHPPVSHGPVKDLIKVLAQHFSRPNLVIVCRKFNKLRIDCAVMDDLAHENQSIKRVLISQSILGLFCALRFPCLDTNFNQRLW